VRSLIVSTAVREKLRTKHSVEVREVEQCFDNKCGQLLEDTRAEHKTDPASLWFIAPTNKDRLLKVVLMIIDGNIHIKSAFEADARSISIYDRYGR
jgi:uncharacterized DUF497 family protein